MNTNVIEHDPAIRVIIRTPTSTRPAVEQVEERKNDRLGDLMQFMDDNDITLGVSYEFIPQNEEFLRIVSEDSSIDDRVKLNLPISKYTKVENVTDDCSICKKTFQINDDVCTTHCRHIYHYDCLNEWVKRNPTCPMCRSSVPITHI